MSERPTNKHVVARMACADCGRVGYLRDRGGMLTSGADDEHWMTTAVQRGIDIEIRVWCVACFVAASNEVARHRTPTRPVDRRG